MLRKVVIESPYAGNVEVHLAYARSCVADSLERGEAPIASHLLYTQKEILDDKIDDERALGIKAGLEWAKHADASVFYIDFGISPGMAEAMADAVKAGRPIEVRMLAHTRAKSPGVQK